MKIYCFYCKSNDPAGHEYNEFGGVIGCIQREANPDLYKGARYVHKRSGNIAIIVCPSFQEVRYRRKFERRERSSRYDRFFKNYQPLYPADQDTLDPLAQQP